MYSRPGLSQGRNVPPVAHKPGTERPTPPMMPAGADSRVSPPPSFDSSPPSFAPSLLGPREREFLFSDPAVQAEARGLFLKQLREEAKQTELKTVLMLAQVKQAEIQNAQKEAELEITKSGLPQKLIQLQMEAAVVQARMKEEHLEHQEKIAETTARHMGEDEAQRKKVDEDFKSTTRHLMFT